MWNRSSRKAFWAILSTRLSPFTEVRGLSNDCDIMRLIQALLTCGQCQNNDCAVMRLMKKGFAHSQPMSEELKAHFAIWLRWLYKTESVICAHVNLQGMTTIRHVPEIKYVPKRGHWTTHDIRKEQIKTGWIIGDELEYGLDRAEKITHHQEGLWLDRRDEQTGNQTPSKLDE